MSAGREFDEDYYERGEATGKSCYTNYRWIPEMTIPLAHEIATLLRLDSHDWILDYGCAKGYLVKALHLLGYTRTYGYDISSYAISNGDPDVSGYISTGIPHWCSFDVVIAKDVLEHSEDPVSDLFKINRRMGDHGKLLVVVPLGDGDRYIIPEMENDETHRIRQPIDWWVDAIQESEFYVESFGFQTGPLMKKRWVDQYPQGHGFVVARRKE